MAYPVSALCWLIFISLFTGISAEEESTNQKPIDAIERNDKLFLKCHFKNYTWEKDGYVLDSSSGDKELDLGSLWNDPRGVYSCVEINEDTEDKKNKKHINVYVRRCQKCIELDAGTISGFLVADVIMIGLIAMAVYFVSGSETRRPGRASDKQNLIDKDAEYQVLGPRKNQHYSELQMKRGAM